MTLYELLGKVVCALIVGMDEECTLFKNSRECSLILGEGVKNYNIKTLSTTDEQVALFLKKMSWRQIISIIYGEKSIERVGKEPNIFD